MTMQKTIQFTKHTDFFEKAKFVIGAHRKGILEHPILLKHGVLVATDGHRMHLAKHIPHTKEETGYYRVVKSNKSEVILTESDRKVFPPFAHVWPKHGDPIWNSVLVSDALHPSKNYTQIIRQMSEEVTLDYNYFEEILKYGFSFTASQYQENGPVLFEDISNDCWALIMPIRI